MAFDPGSAQAVKSLISNGVPTLEQALKALPGLLDFAIRNHHDIKVRLLYAAAKPIIQNIGEGAAELATTFVQLLGSAGAPLALWERSGDWKDVKQKLTEMAAKIDTLGPELGAHWKGDAFSAYQAANGIQSKAVTNLANAAGSASTALDSAAGSGLLFYVAAGALMVDIAKVVAGSAAATVITDGFGTLPALGVLAVKIWDAAAKGAQIVKGLAGLAALLIGQVNAEHALRGQPEGMADKKWPVPTTASFSDSSVTDGDVTDWNRR